MAEKNTVSSRVHGDELGNPHAPELVDTYKYHLHFKNQDDAYRLIGVLAQKDEATFVTTTTRPDTFLVYDPISPEAHRRKFREMKYYEYVKILYGPYESDYFIFGNGKYYYSLPKLTD